MAKHDKQLLRRAKAAKLAADREARQQAERAALQAVRQTKQSEFSLARPGELVTFSRDVDRWETLKPYDNARGVKRGEVAMVVEGKYFYTARQRRRGRQRSAPERQCCDVMVGGTVILGIPVTVLRPVEGADADIPNDSEDLEQP